LDSPSAQSHTNIREITPTYIGEDGLVLGFYNLYGGTQFIGERAFGFTKETGVFDIGSAVDNGDFNISSIAVVDVDGALYFGNVKLTPVPVPAAAWLFMSAFGVLGWFKRKASTEPPLG
jgi:hypothetical protein